MTAARDLFDRKGYAGTSTREVAEQAGVSETLIYRYFGSKADLFRHAMVLPFVEFVREVADNDASGTLLSHDDETATREFIGALYDLLHAHRGMVAIFWSADSHNESDLAETGLLDEVREHLEVLADVGRHYMEARGFILPRPDLTTRVIIATVAGMATFGRSFYGVKPPSRNEIVEELTQAILHGSTHRAETPRSGTRRATSRTRASTRR